MQWGLFTANVNVKLCNKYVKYNNLIFSHIYVSIIKYLSCNPRIKKDCSIQKWKIKIERDF